MLRGASSLIKPLHFIPGHAGLAQRAPTGARES